MAKTKYVKVDIDHVAYRSPEGYGWEVSFDDNRFWISDDGIDDLMELLREIKKEAGK